MPKPSLLVLEVLNPKTPLVAHGVVIDNALEDFNFAVDFEPEMATNYAMRALIKYSLNDKNGACLDWSKAGELGYEKAYDEIKEKCND
jgi:hypothetical protein